MILGGASAAGAGLVALVFLAKNFIVTPTSAIVEAIPEIAGDHCDVFDEPSVNLRRHDRDQIIANVLDAAT